MISSLTQSDTMTSKADTKDTHDTIDLQIERFTTTRTEKRLEGATQSDLRVKRDTKAKHLYTKPSKIKNRVPNRLRMRQFLVD